MMKFNFKHTLTACYIGYIVQAIVNTLSPLLFIIFNEQLGLSLTEISILITVNFIVQISMDFASTFFVNVLGYRKSVVIAELLATVGLISMSLFTVFVPNKFVALLASTILMSMGGGIIEVVVSPIVEAIPGDQKASAMSILHSFYCWGQLAVVLLTTLFLAVFGMGAWIALPILYATVPAIGALMFTSVPVNQLESGGEKPSFKSLIKQRGFWLMVVIMICAGASEVSMAQWGSLFAEVTLGIPKALGDLLGPSVFAICMGLGRVIFGRVADKIRLERWLCASFALCIVAYLVTTLFNIPLIASIGFALSGISVAILWPGTYSLGAKEIPTGGTLIFALFALSGDIGCTLGPDLVGIVSDAVSASGNGFLSILISGSGISAGLRTGLFLATLFPIIGFIASLILSVKLSKNKSDKT
jgi:fucose permease